MSLHPLKIPPRRALDHVLVVDDNYASRFIMKSQLERMRCDVTLAENGRIAVDIARLRQFDLILMDIQMPVLGGVDAAHLIQTSDTPNRCTPIIAVTAYSLQDFKQRYDTSLFAGILLKPFAAKSLMELWLDLAEDQPSAQAVSIKSEATVGRLKDTIPTALLDERVLAPLCQAAAADILARVLSRFWLGCAELIMTMDDNSETAQSGNLDALANFRSAAHGLKGAAANIGLLRASQICAALQNAKAEEIEAALSALKICLKDAKPELDSYIAIHSQEPSVVIPGAQLNDNARYVDADMPVPVWSN